MSEIIQPLPNKDDREGNKYPSISETPLAQERSDMLYSYDNTVKECYAGDTRVYVKRFGDYLRDSKSQVYDPAKGCFIDIPIRYSAPNLAFSDNLNPGSTGVASEASLQDRVALPLISYYLIDMKRDDSRAIDRVVRTRFRPEKVANPNEKYSRAIVTSAPMPIDYVFQVDIWTEYREYYYQLLTCFLQDFNPYSYLYDVYDIDDPTQKLQYVPYVPMFLESNSDTSNFIPGSDRRVVRGTLRINVKGWLTPVIHNKPYVHNTKMEIN